MRLRLFNIRDEEQKLPVIVNQLPAPLLHPSRWGSRQPHVSGNHACVLEERDGTLYVVSTTGSEQPLLNGQPFESTVVLPGDRLTLGSITLVISYEHSESMEPESFCSQQPDPGTGLSASEVAQQSPVLSGSSDLEKHVEDNDPCSKEHSACCSLAELVHASIP